MPDVSTVLTGLSHVQGGLLFLLVIGAAVTDATGRRVPNGLCLAAVIAGLCLSYMRGGVWAGDWDTVSLVASLAAMAIGFGLFFLFYLIGGLGAGDVKLMAGVGALAASVTFLLWVVVSTAFAGVPLAVGVLLFRRDLKGGLSRSARGMFRWKYKRAAVDVSAKAEATAKIKDDVVESTATTEAADATETQQATDETKSPEPDAKEKPQPPVVTIPYAVAVALGVFATIWLYASRQAWDLIPFF